jgi:adenylate cyclase
MIAAMPPPNALRLVLWIVLSASLIGALFAHFEYQSPGAAANDYAHGALLGGLTGGALSSLEIFVLRRGAGGPLRQAPFLVSLGLRSLYYLGVILFMEAAVNRLMPGANGEIAPVTRADIAFSLVLSLGYNLYFGVDALLGSGVLFAFIAGRYHRPRIEERALLFIDMRSSTAIAERLGEARFLDFLNAFIVDLSLAIAEAGGEIHKYVGDEIIATWRLAPGPNDAGCVRACFSALDRLAARGADYQREFGLGADFRAGLHCGPVAVGELGYLKKEIALIGNAMNTASRIQQACRETGCRVLASAALLERLAALPPGVRRRALGALPLRGKIQAIELYALEAESPRDSIGSPRPRDPSLATRSS